MRTLDETDLAILDLLLEDARRPYNDIAERVDVSAPTVSDRIDRLQEVGVIDSFTVDIDRTTFTDGIELLIDIALTTGPATNVVEDLSRIDGVEHVFLTTDARLVAVATLQSDRVGRVLTDTLDVDDIESYRIHLLEDRAWRPSISDHDGVEPDSEPEDERATIAETA
ncbi:Lrp/AsnC family transcriptional regulator [Halovivax sp.]|uniref:Lrp/AsnC family transcriptional regulator n=1 Tax=Halovivax sp. TaxID=1935978 RepID=UPI0025BFA883|nr:Lrp/AsnC family transcriptional regulator [Halovivax sp.]